MPLTSQQIAAELQRKRNLGIKPTNAANMGAWNKLAAAPKPSPMVMGSAPQPVVQPVKQPTPTLGQGDGYVRKTLTDNGYADGDIGWDAGRKMVTVQGKDFLSPTGNIGGWSTASQDAITGALGKFRDTQTNNKTQDILSRMETAMGQQQPPPQFNYDPNSDPVYQAALRRAQANAGTASGNAQAEMNRRGILNSTITGDRLGQIQQAEYGRVSDTVLPQLFQQAYTRHRDQVGDQYQQGRDKIGDLGNLLGTNTGLQDRARNFEQQGWDNRFNFGQATGQFANGQKTLAGQNLDWQKSTDQRNFDQSKYESDRDYRYKIQQQSIQNGQWQQQFSLDTEKFGFQQASELWSQAFQQNNGNQDDEYRKAQLEHSLNQADRSATQQAQNSIMSSGLVTVTKTKGLDSNGADTETQAYAVPNPDALNRYIKSLNLSDDATDSLLYQYKLDSYVKK